MGFLIGLLIAWIAASILAFFLTTVAAFACKNRLARKGYRIRKRDNTISETIMTLIKVFIPVYNLFIIIGTIFMPEEKMDAALLAALRKEGRIIEPEEWG